MLEFLQNSLAFVGHLKPALSFAGRFLRVSREIPLQKDHTVAGEEPTLPDHSTYHAGRDLTVNNHYHITPAPRQKQRRWKRRTSTRPPQLE